MNGQLGQMPQGMMGSQNKLGQGFPNLMTSGGMIGSDPNL